MVYADVIPFGVGIGVYTLFTIYHIKLANTFVGPYKDKVFYFFSHLITVLPIVLYSFQIIDLLVFPDAPKSLRIFYAEWSITTSLILANLGRLARFDIRNYIFITLCDLIMIMFGYISYVSLNTAIVYTFFGLGCVSYCCIAVFFMRYAYKNYKTSLQIPLTCLFGDCIRYRVYRVILGTILVSWSLYPITYILYKEAIFSIETTTAAYVTLDICTKTIFTNLVLGSREMYRKAPSLLGCFAFKVFRVYPDEIRSQDPSSVPNHIVVSSQPTTPRIFHVDSESVESTNISTRVTHVATNEVIPSREPTASRVFQVDSESVESTNISTSVATNEVISSCEPTLLKPIFVPRLESVDERHPTN